MEINIQSPYVIITGQRGSGKTTLAEAIKHTAESKGIVANIYEEVSSLDDVVQIQKKHTGLSIIVLSAIELRDDIITLLAKIQSIDLGRGVRDYQVNIDVNCFPNVFADRATNTQNEAFNKAYREPTEQNLARLTNAELRFLISKLIEENDLIVDGAENGLTEACEEEDWRHGNSDESIESFVDFEPNNYAEFANLEDYLAKRFESPSK